MNNDLRHRVTRRPRLHPRATHAFFESLEGKRFLAATPAAVTRASGARVTSAAATIVAATASSSTTASTTSVTTRTRTDSAAAPAAAAGSTTILDPGTILQPVATAAPIIATTVLQGATIVAGQSFHIEATGTVVPGGQVEDASFAWDFGDPGSKYNAMPGFNAAHVYERAGTYIVTLKVTASNGKASTQQTSVTVVPSATNAKTLYVAANGSDANDGRAAAAPLASLAQALALATDDTTILLRRGDTFLQSKTLEIRRNNVTVSSYGSGAAPTLRWTGARDRNNILWIGNATRNVTVRGLTFDSIYNGDTEQTGMPTGILAGGRNVVIRENTFLNIGYCINANQMPTGMIVQDNRAPLPMGVRDYLCWTQGSDIVIVGNVVANSTREHNVRVSGVDRITVAFNNLTNLDRTTLGDARDSAKGTIVVQKGSYAYVSDNQMRGPAGIGPLGQGDGLPEKWGRSTHARVQNNVQYGGFFLQHGAEHVTLSGNTIFRDELPAIEIIGWDGTYGRGNSDVVIDNNVAVNNGPLGRGNFLLVDSAVEGITLTDNVYVAPNLAPGGWGAAAVWVNAVDLSSFTRIDGNTWPSGVRGSGYAQGAVNFVDTSYTMAGHKDASEWNAIAQVGEDRFEDVTIDSALIRAFGIMN